SPARLDAQRPALGVTLVALRLRTSRSLIFSVGRAGPPHGPLPCLVGGRAGSEAPRELWRLSGQAPCVWGGRILGYVETTEVSAGAVGSWRADGGGVGPSDRACGQGSGDHQRGAQEAGAPGRGRSRRAASPANHQRAGGASEPSS